MKANVKASVLFVSILLAGCASESQIRGVLEKHPDLVFNAIEKNPDKFMEVAQKASQAAQVKMQEEAEKEEEARKAHEAANPLKPVITPDRAAQGSPSAPIQIVEYSDFQCPYCGRGYSTLEQVLKAYPGKIHFVFKNLPLTQLHPMAMPAAKRFEAIALQSAEKAYKYHDEVFQNQEKLNEEGEKFLDAAAKKAGANLARMKKDMESKKVKDRIEADVKEAESFGISGTPGFIINGQSLRGAYPFPAFKQIIDKQLAEK